MSPIVSNAEIEIRVELSRRAVKVLSQQAIILDETIADFMLLRPDLKHDIPIFIDGPPHLKPKVAERDDYVDMILEKRHYNRLRFPYKVPLSPQRLKEICDEIEAARKIAC